MGGGSGGLKGADPVRIHDAETEFGTTCFTEPSGKLYAGLTAFKRKLTEEVVYVPGVIQPTALEESLWSIENEVLRRVDVDYSGDNMDSGAIEDVVPRPGAWMKRGAESIENSEFEELLGTGSSSVLGSEMKLIDVMVGQEPMFEDVDAYLDVSWC